MTTKPTTTNDLPKAYSPIEHEARVRAAWDDARVFHADPKPVNDGEKKPYSIVIPPPNVTAALHLGHGLNNTLQDVLARAHRMMGAETLWMPGTDHAGIATQTVVEKRLLATEKKRRTDYQRDEFVAKVQAFKDEYERVITDQLKMMGCSCDWERQRFTMDETCAKAVREAFFRLFADGLIYRGKRLVNWDPVTQTVLADDEVEMREVDGFFYYLRYPLCDEQGSLINVTLPDGTTTDHITVATTRPETYLGDTGVAMNPKDPRWPALRDANSHVKLPFVGRIVPIVADDYVVLPASMQSDPEAAAKDPKAQYATGFLKVTPAHDVNDEQIGKRHNLAAINVMAPDASVSRAHGWGDQPRCEAEKWVGLSREDARKAIVAAFRDAGFLEAQRPYQHSVGHSYRSHAPIEPYLSDQWYIATKKPIPLFREGRTDEEFNALIDGTDVPVFSLAGLAQTALLGGDLTFIPERYAKTYQTWHENLRDWPISRQLWWGHRIPVWKVTPWSRSTEQSRDLVGTDITAVLSTLGFSARASSFKADMTTDVFAVVGESTAERVLHELADFTSRSISQDARWPDGAEAPQAISKPDWFDRVMNTSARDSLVRLAVCHWTLEDDVLDTWFSSALWPLSTMGWPAPGRENGDTEDLLQAFNPTNVLCTAREIITLWVSRMVMFNRYFLAEKKNGKYEPGPSPFRDVFIHAMIQDGEGRKMSKSLGNGVDPLDIIQTHGADAMRFTLCHMTTQTQDVRMPVERDAKSGKNTSPKFDLGRNFCNKLWNASRFALSKLDGKSVEGVLHPPRRPLVDRWMLSRLASSVEEINRSIRGYEFSGYAQSLYDLLWRDFCDWYLEGVKPTINEDAEQRAILRAALDVILRVLHPVAPFITETIYERVRELPRGDIAGLGLHEGDPPLLCVAPWPTVLPGLRDENAERDFERLRTLIESVRQARASQNVPPKRQVTLHLNPQDAGLLGLVRMNEEFVRAMCGVKEISIDAPSGPSSVFTMDAFEHRLGDLVDVADAGAERTRLEAKVADLTKSIAALEGRLANPGYAERAPAHLVQQTRDQLAAQIAERDATMEALKGL